MWIGVVLGVLLSLGAAGTQATPNPPQQGENGTCADFNALLLLPGMHLDTIEVEGGTGFDASQTGGAQIYVDFYDASGTWIGDNSRNRTVSPAAATLGTVCVGLFGGGWPDLPAPGAVWIFVDGL